MKIGNTEIDQDHVRLVAIAISEIPPETWRDMSQDEKAEHQQAARRAIRASYKMGWRPSQDADVS